MTVDRAVGEGNSDASVQTANVLTVFMLAMTKHPEVFKKAQEEIDRVIGPDRLPDFDDRDSLPYLNCLIKEVYRYVCLSILTPLSPGRV